MNFGDQLLMLLYVLFSLVLCWLAANFMIEKKRIWPFLPLLGFGVLANFRAALIFYGLHNTVYWYAIGFIYLPIIAFLLYVIMKVQNE